MRPKWNEAIELLAEIAQKYGITIEQLKNKHRVTGYIPAVQEFSERGLALGASTVTLGKILGRDHVTIMYHSSEKRRENKKRKPWPGPRSPEQKYKAKLAEYRREERKHAEISKDFRSD